MAEETEKTRILFICLGNICRSPMAEAVLRHMVEKKGIGEQFNIKSAALGDWHSGSKGDHRMIMTLKKNDVPVAHRARQINLDDFNFFDYIFGMDDENIKALKKMAPAKSKAKIMLFGEYDENGEKIIEDPYYDSDLKGFEKCYTQCVSCSNGFLKSLNV